MSTAIFDSEGNVYNQTKVFGDTFTLNQTALAEIGPPFLAGGNVLSNMSANWAVSLPILELGRRSPLTSSKIGGLIAHVTLFWGRDVIAAFKLANARKQPDRHWVAMQKYPEAPMWWYAVLLVLSFFAGTGCCRRHAHLGLIVPQVLSSSSRETPLFRGGATSLPSQAEQSLLCVLEFDRACHLSRRTTAVLDSSLWSHGQRYRDKPALQDDRWCYPPW